MTRSKKTCIDTRLCQHKPSYTRYIRISICIPVKICQSLGYSEWPDHGLIYVELTSILVEQDDHL